MEEESLHVIPSCKILLLAFVHDELACCGYSARLTDGFDQFGSGLSKLPTWYPARASGGSGCAMFFDLGVGASQII